MMEEINMKIYEDNFFNQIIITKRKDDDKDHCWLWHGKHFTGGYGIFQTPISNSSHQFAYRRWVGNIPDGMEIDHICEITSCCNPNHLELVTRKENVRRIRERQDVISTLYNITNSEFDVDKTPELNTISKAINYLESSQSNIGCNLGKFELDKKIGEKTVVDMLDIMLAKRENIFKFNINNNEDLIKGYKRKYFFNFFPHLFDWFPSITVKDIFDYYTPHLKETYQWDWQNHSTGEIKLIQEPLKQLIILLKKNKLIPTKHMIIEEIEEHNTQIKYHTNQILILKSKKQDEDEEE